jgi:hypothetical protein
MASWSRSVFLDGAPRDPGWRLFGSNRSAPVVQLRSLLTITVLAIAFFPVALSLMIDPEHQSGRDFEPAWTLWPLVAGVAASLLGVGWARGRLLSGTTARALFVSYNRRFFIGFAFAELPTLLGFVVAFVTSRLWPCVVGLAVSLVGFAMMAPTARNIHRDEERVQAVGSPVSLWDALTLPPDRSASGTP